MSGRDEVVTGSVHRRMKYGRKEVYFYGLDEAQVERLRASRPAPILGAARIPQPVWVHAERP